MTGNTINNNGDSGVVAFSGTTLIGNTVRGNVVFGFDLICDFGACGYGSNVLGGNNGASSEVQGGVQIGTNICNNTTTCP